MIANDNISRSSLLNVFNGIEEGLSNAATAADFKEKFKELIEFSLPFKDFIGDDEETQLDRALKGKIFAWLAWHTQYLIDGDVPSEEEFNGCDAEYENFSQAKVIEVINDANFDYIKQIGNIVLNKIKDGLNNYIQLQQKIDTGLYDDATGKYKDSWPNFVVLSSIPNNQYNSMLEKGIIPDFGANRQHIAINLETGALFLKYSENGDAVSQLGGTLTNDSIVVIDDANAGNRTCNENRGLEPSVETKNIARKFILCDKNGVLMVRKLEGSLKNESWFINLGSKEKIK